MKKFFGSDVLDLETQDALDQIQGRALDDSGSFGFDNKTVFFSVSLSHKYFSRIQQALQKHFLLFRTATQIVVPLPLSSINDSRLLELLRIGLAKVNVGFEYGSNHDATALHGKWLVPTSFDGGRRQKLSATPDLSGTVLPLCLIPNSALKSAPLFKSVMPKASACVRLPA